MGSGEGGQSEDPPPWLLLHWEPAEVQLRLEGACAAASQRERNVTNPVLSRAQMTASCRVAQPV